MSEKRRALKFAAVMCITSCLLLTGAFSMLKERQDKNIETDKEKNILKSVGLIKTDVSYSSEMINSLFKKNIKKVWITPSGKIIYKNMDNLNLLTIYIYLKNDIIESYVIPIDTKGLWGKILGYLAINNDGSTISGFTVYSHAETPGLGGEIERKWFQDNFVGKKIVNKDNNFVSISVAKGVTGSYSDEKKKNYVDGISGATLTGKYLSKGLKATLYKYEKVSVRFRYKHIKKNNKNKS